MAVAKKNNTKSIGDLQLFLFLAEIGQDEQGRAYAVSAVAHTLQCDFAIADSHLKKSFEIAESNRTMDLKKFVLFQAGIVATSRGDFKTAQQHFTECIKAATTVGDLRTWEEAHCMLSTVYFFKGDFQKSISLVRDALQSAKKRGDMQAEVLGICTQLRNLYEFNRKTKVQDLMISLRRAIDTYYTDASSNINYYGLLSLIKIRQREYDEAFKHLEYCSVDLMKEREPISWLSFIGYTAVAEGFTLLTDPNVSKQWKQKPQKFQNLVKNFMSSFKRYSSVFAFALPRFK